MQTVVITGETLTLDELVAVCRFDAFVELDKEAVERIRASRKIIDDFVEREEVVYGVTTGFGKFSDVVISKEDCVQLQKNVIMTHAVGAGEAFPAEVVRGIILLRLNNLAKGFSGARPDSGNPGCHAEQTSAPRHSAERLSGCQRRSGSALPHGASHDGHGAC